jgi:hypothetical protein
MIPHRLPSSSLARRRLYHPLICPATRYQAEARFCAGAVANAVTRPDRNGKRATGIYGYSIHCRSYPPAISDGRWSGGAVHLYSTTPVLIFALATPKSSRPRRSTQHHTRNARHVDGTVVEPSPPQSSRPVSIQIIRVKAAKRFWWWR